MVKVKIRKIGANAVRANLAAADEAAPYCGFLYTMWKDVQVDLNHKAHSATHGFYDIVTYLKILYQMSNDVKNRHMMNSMWARDVQGGHSVVANDAVVNPGQYYRIQRAAASRTMELSGKLLVDCLNVARPIPDNVSINITYYPMMNSMTLGGSNTLTNQTPTKPPNIPPPTRNQTFHRYSLETRSCRYKL